MSKKKIQIDVVKEVGDTSLMECNLYIDGGCVSKIFVTKSDYLRLIDDGFFVRPGDSSNCGAINTTKVYIEQ